MRHMQLGHTKRHHLKQFILALLFMVLVMTGSCASDSIKGDVIRIWQHEITIRKCDDTVVTVNVDNVTDVRVLDTVVVKDEKAKVRERLLDDDFCLTALCNL